MKYTGKKVDDLGTLCAILGVAPAELGYLSLNMDKNVRVYNTPKKNRPNEMREIAAPNKNLKQVQRKIKEQILSKYTYEEYVYGLGGSTLKNHALVHKGAKSLVQIDIRDFYPSISHKLVFEMWIDKFGFSAGVARILTKLTTMHGGLMQGFPTSSHIAAVVAEDFTLAINDYCKKNSMKFSQYADDFNMSGNGIDYRSVFKLVVTIGRKYGLSIKRKKTRVNSKLVGKNITGVALIDQHTRAPREIRQRAIRALRDLTTQPDNEKFQNRVAGYAGFLKHLNKRDGSRYKKLLKKIK